LAIALLISTNVAALPWLGDLPGRRSGTVMAVFRPGTSAERALASVVGAGGTPLVGGAFANVMIALGDEPGFVGRLRDQGAILVLDAANVTLCNPPEPQSTAI